MNGLRACVTTKRVLLLIGLLCLGMRSEAVAADSGGLGSRRTAGVLFLGGAALMVKQGMDFASESDDFYARYKVATDPAEIDRLYQRSNNRNIKSQLSWALAAAFTVTGMRLVLTRGAQAAPAREELSRLPGGLEVSSCVTPGQLGVRLSRRF